jgi:hypothetical protein
MQAPTTRRAVRHCARALRSARASEANNAAVNSNDQRAEIGSSSPNAALNASHDSRALTLVGSPRPCAHSPPTRAPHS